MWWVCTVSVVLTALVDASGRSRSRSVRGRSALSARYVARCDSELSIVWWEYNGDCIFSSDWQTLSIAHCYAGVATSYAAE